MKRSKCCNYAVNIIIGDAKTSDATISGRIDLGYWYKCEKCKKVCDWTEIIKNETKQAESVSEVVQRGISKYQKVLKTLYGDKV